MEMQASRTLAVSQQQAWNALNDPEVLKQCIPGCDKVETTGENQYTVGMALKIGPVSAKFAGKIQLSDIAPPERYTIAFDGQGGVAGFGKGQAQVRLEPLPDEPPGQARCELHYTVHATVGGKIAQLGQRLIDGAAKGMAEDFFKRFDDRMREQYPPLPVPEALPAAAEEPPAPDGDAVAAPAPAPAAATPGGIPAWGWVAGAAVLVGLVLWLR
ncbi:MAG: CoxG family protein [Burkholderiaceae bacterium]